MDKLDKELNELLADEYTAETGVILPDTTGTIVYTVSCALHGVLHQGYDWPTGEGVWTAFNYYGEVAETHFQSGCQVEVTLTIRKK